MEFKNIAGQLTIVTTGTVAPSSPPLPPKIVPGYLNDLLARMASDEELPRPPGAPKTNENRVSFQAHREAERINDPSIVSQIAERLEYLDLSKEIADITFVLACVIHNTRDTDTEHLMATVLKRLPSKGPILKRVFWHLNRCPTPAVRAFAKAQLMQKDGKNEGEALDVFAKGAESEDFEFLSKLLLGDELCEGSYFVCVWAVIKAGGGAAVPALERFVEKHKKNRKAYIRQAVAEALEGIQKLKARTQ